MPDSGDMVYQPSQPPGTTTQSPSVIAATASPMTFTATRSGRMHVSGGLTAVQIGRGAWIDSLPASIGLYPLCRGDRLVLTYLIAPTLTFLPD